jgi:8-oxo-dGTP pyrophosphatase MutT (NUDIX family)
MKFVNAMKNNKILVSLASIALTAIGFQQYIIHQQKEFISKPSAQYLSNLIADYNKYSDPELVKIVTDGFEKRPSPDAPRESLITRLLNQGKITMYGAHISDTLPKDKPGRDGYEAHPYRKAGTGANVIVMYTDETTGKLKILLGMKYKHPADHKQGLTGKFITFGGYMKPAPLEGIFKPDQLDEEERDKTEESLLRGGDTYASIKKETSEIDLSFDQNLASTARRELVEETGLACDPKECIQVSLGTSSDYGKTNDPRLHTVVENFLFSFKSLNPDKINPGSDIAKIVSVDVDDIKIDKTFPAQIYGSPISRYSIEIDGEKYPVVDQYGEVIEQAKHRAIELLNLQKTGEICYEQESY